MIYPPTPSQPLSNTSQTEEMELIHREQILVLLFLSSPCFGRRYLTDWLFLRTIAHAHATDVGINLDSCGLTEVSSSRVVGGADAVLGEWPWQAQIQVSGKGFTCGGSLITPKWVLTAAHCIITDDPDDYRVVMGDVNRNITEGSEQSLGVVRIIKHHDYSIPVPNHNDVALIQLSRPPHPTDFVNTVCLPEMGAGVPPGTKCFITGWGLTSRPGNQAIILQQAELEVVSNRACAEKHATSLNMLLDKGTWRVTEAMICAGDAGKTPRNGCNGDSGGPFVCQNAAGQWVLQGVVNWGDPYCLSKNHFSVFARVSRFRDWIQENIALYSYGI